MCGFIFLLEACGPPAEPQPPNLLTKGKMTDILADIHLAEAQVGHQFPNRDSAKMAFNLLEAQIFAKHNVSDSVFRQSYEYYLLYLKELDQIYEAVVDTLSLRELKARNQVKSVEEESKGEDQKASPSPIP